jgi:ubiquinone/menaquinone biosynthesis C-methylase UbiE
MSIDFHKAENRYTYSGREADQNWRNAITTIVDPLGKHVADVGCGGGVYTRAWAQLGAQEVIGVDFSEQMVQAASEANAGIANITICQGSATATGLDNKSVDIVFERALIHHLTDLAPCFQEAKRVLQDNGIYIIQDRTLEDVMIPGSPEHLRGYFFERYPRLLEVERVRRPGEQQVKSELHREGFAAVQMFTLWETRKVYADRLAFADDLAARTGRSILHELDNVELADLISYVQSKLPSGQSIIEKDRWTIWWAILPE